MWLWLFPCHCFLLALLCFFFCSFSSHYRPFRYQLSFFFTSFFFCFFFFMFWFSFLLFCVLVFFFFVFLLSFLLFCVLTFFSAFFVFLFTDFGIATAEYRVFWSMKRWWKMRTTFFILIWLEFVETKSTWKESKKRKKERENKENWLIFVEQGRIKDEENHFVFSFVFSSCLQFFFFCYFGFFFLFLLFFFSFFIISV